jgi:hypothetical protein
MPTLGDYQQPGALPLGQIRYGAPVVVVPAASSVQALAYNATRNYLLVINDSAAEAYVGIGFAADNGVGIPLAAGAAFEMNRGSGNIDPSPITVYGTGNIVVIEGT